jgi:hypothetical protein
MFGVGTYATVRQLVLLRGLSRREVARQLGISQDAGDSYRLSQSTGRRRQAVGAEQNQATAAAETEKHPQADRRPPPQTSTKQTGP